MSNAASEHMMTGDVGIFWVDQGQLIVAVVPVANGIDDGRFVNGPYDHDPYWKTVQRTHVHLWDVEYHQGPRGRVLFNRAEHRYYVYLDKVLCTNPITRMMLEHVHLPRKHTSFRTDMHDTTDPADLDRLFFLGIRSHIYAAGHDVRACGCHTHSHAWAP